MERHYKTGSPERNVSEFLPLTFDVSEFKQTFSTDEHGEVMKSLDERLAKLEKDSWTQRFAGWLRPILGCL